MVTRPETELELDSVVELVETGRLNVAEAERRIEELVPAYVLPIDATGPEELTAWEERRQRLVDKALELLRKICQDDFVMRVVDLARLVVAAGKLLSPAVAAWVRYTIGQHLFRLAAWKSAADQFEEVAGL